MKFAVILLLFSCSYLVKSYDPALSLTLSNVKKKSEKISCEKKVFKDWKDLEEAIIEVYTIASWRNDPYSDEIVSLQTSFGRAYASNDKDFCKSLVDIQKERIWKIGTLWGKR